MEHAAAGQAAHFQTHWCVARSGLGEQPRVVQRQGRAELPGRRVPLAAQGVGLAHNAHFDGDLIDAGYRVSEAQIKRDVANLLRDNYRRLVGKLEPASPVTATPEPATMAIR